MLAFEFGKVNDCSLMSHFRVVEDLHNIGIYELVGVVYCFLNELTSLLTPFYGAR